MKHLYLLVIAALLLVGCGLNEAAQDTTASIGTGNEKGGGEETGFLPTGETILTALKDIQCEGMTIPASTQARVSFRLELAEDALQLGGNGPFYLYGGGMLQAAGNKSYDKQISIQCDQIEKTAVTLQKSSQEAGIKLFVENLNLTAQIDGIKTQLSDTTLTGMAIAEGQNPSFLLENVGLHDLAAFHCQGQMIPNSSIASIIMIGELKDGQQFSGAGVLDTGLDPKATANVSAFECGLKGNGRITSLAASAAQPGTTLANLVLEGLELRNASGQSFLIEIASVCGFNIGMPPT